MKKIVRTIAAMQAAVMILTSTAFAEELLDETIFSAEETISMEETVFMQAFEEETFGMTEEGIDLNSFDEELIEDFAELEEEAFEEDETIAMIEADEMTEGEADAGMDLMASLGEEGLILDADTAEGTDKIGMGGSRELANVASSNYAGKEVVDEMKNNAQLLVNGYIDSLCKAYPEMVWMAPIMKNLFGKILGLGNGTEVNPYALIMEQLWVIENKLDDMQAHLDNRILLNTFGNDFNDLTAASTSLRTKINDYYLRYEDETERNDALAKLYNSNEYGTLMRALNKASNNFAGKTSNDLDQQSFFDAAYRSACGSVMFSGEALDIMSVYMTRQIAYYMEAYGYINIVLDAYESVYGANACRATRNQMLNRLGTKTGSGLEKDEQGVFGLLENFLDSTSRTIFVNKSENTKVYLSRDLAVVQCNVNVPWKLFNDCLRKTPKGIGEKELEAIAKYAVNTKKMSVLGFLTEVVGFRLANPVDENSKGRNLMVCSQKILDNLQFAPLEVALPLKNNKTSVDTVGTVWQKDVVVHFQNAE